MEMILKTIMAAVAGLCTYLFGRADMWLMALVTMVVVDYLTGMAKGAVLEQLSSKVGFKGIIKKAMYFAVVAVAVVADDISGGHGVLRTTVIGFLIGNEALSILENYAAVTGSRAPQALTNMLKKIRGDSEE